MTNNGSSTPENPATESTQQFPQRLRVHALARLLGLTSKETLAHLGELGVAVRTAQSSIDRAVAEAVAARLAGSTDASPNDTPVPKSSAEAGVATEAVEQPLFSAAAAEQHETVASQDTPAAGPLFLPPNEQAGAPEASSPRRSRRRRSSGADTEVDAPNPDATSSDATRDNAGRDAADGNESEAAPKKKSAKSGGKKAETKKAETKKTDAKKADDKKADDKKADDKKAGEKSGDKKDQTKKAAGAKKDPEPTKDGAAGGDDEKSSGKKSGGKKSRKRGADESGADLVTSGVDAVDLVSPASTDADGPSGAAAGADDGSRHTGEASEIAEQSPEATDASDGGAADADGSAADESTGDEANEGRSRRRRRGRRGRGRGRGDQNSESEGENGESAGIAADDAERTAGDGAANEQSGGENTADGAGTADTGDSATEDADAAGADTDGDDATPSSKRRRRRRRRKGGGDGDEVAADDPPNTVVHEREPRSKRVRDEVQGISGSTRLEAKRQRRRDGRDAGRRRPPILSESEFLARREAVERVMVVRERAAATAATSHDGHSSAVEDYTQVAVLEDGVLVEHFVTTETSHSMVGNIYLGRVQNVLPGMEAAFVDIGRGRNGVLYAGEVNWEAAGLGGGNRKIEQALKPGDYVVVQVSKDPVGHKGARLTTQISLAGRYLVYVPGGSSTGISRKLPDVERKRLKQILAKVVPEDAGVIVRTASEGVSAEELGADVERLEAKWKAIEAASAEHTEKASGSPRPLYEEPDLLVRVVRDLFNEDFRKLVVEGEKAWSLVSGYVEDVAPDLAERLERFTVEQPGAPDSFSVHRIDEQLAKALDRKVWLPSGGTLIIEHTEAMTVVDVNTGKFTGSGGNLEETVTRNNLEAAEEIVRQMRLRDIGGMIIVDFIDMVLESNRDLVLRRLTEALSRDRTRHQVSEVTSLGLVQLTRKRLGTGLLEAFSTTCTACSGRGVIVHSSPVEVRQSDDSGSRSSDGAGSRRGRRSRRKNEAPAVEDKTPHRPAAEHPMFRAMAAHSDDDESSAPTESDERSDARESSARESSAGHSSVGDTAERGVAEGNVPKGNVAAGNAPQQEIADGRSADDVAVAKGSAGADAAEAGNEIATGIGDLSAAEPAESTTRTSRTRRSRGGRSRNGAASDRAGADTASHASEDTASHASEDTASHAPEPNGSLSAGTAVDPSVARPRNGSTSAVTTASTSVDAPAQGADDAGAAGAAEPVAGVVVRRRRVVRRASAPVATEQPAEPVVPSVTQAPVAVPVASEAVTVTRSARRRGGRRSAGAPRTTE